MLSNQEFDAFPIYKFVTGKIITFVNKKADGGKWILERGKEEQCDH